MIHIESERLIVRDYAKDHSDLAMIHAFTGDPEVAAHSSWGPLTQAETLDYLKGALAAINGQPRLNYALGIILKSNQQIIGQVSLNIRNLSTMEAELGYSLGKNHWQQGYASEAARTAVHFAFRDLGIHRIFATTSPLNLGSQKVLEKIGFRQEGFLRKNVLQRGTWRDSILYAALEEEWTGR